MALGGFCSEQNRYHQYLVSFAALFEQFKNDRAADTPDITVLTEFLITNMAAAITQISMIKDEIEMIQAQLPIKQKGSNEQFN